eukprot:1156571-Pelagomonas_calceolata.AAC.3
MHKEGLILGPSRLAALRVYAFDGVHPGECGEALTCPVMHFCCPWVRCVYWICTGSKESRDKCVKCACMRTSAVPHWASGLALPHGLCGGALPFRTGDLSLMHTARLGLRSLSFFLLTGPSCSGAPCSLHVPKMPLACTSALSQGSSLLPSATQKSPVIFACPTEISWPAHPCSVWRRALCHCRSPRRSALCSSQSVATLSALRRLALIHTCLW